MNDSPWQIEILRPWALVLLAVLPLVIYYGRRSLVHFSLRQRNLSLAIRMVLVTVLVVALCGIRIHGRTSQQCIVFVEDASRSVSPGSLQPKLDALRQAAASGGYDAEFRAIKFAAEPGPIEQTLGEARDTGRTADLDPYQTNIAAAITAARASIPSTLVPTIVLLSDGNQTTGDALAAARAAGCPISVVPLPGQPKEEVYVAAVSAPGRAGEGEPLSVDVVVGSTGKNQGTVNLLLGSKGVDQRQVQLDPGENRFRFRQVVAGREKVTFTARLEGFKDTFPENNEAAAVVFVAPRPRVLLVESRPEAAEHLAVALTKEHIEVEVRRPEAMPRRLDDLRQYDSLVLSNVPATSLPSERMELLRRYVHDFGGGLITIGGDRALTAGGYHGTTLEEILPVVCESNKDKPTPSLAMVLVLDQSGSMKGSAIELAQQAARRAVEQLGPRDRIGIIAFEDKSRWISEIHSAADKQPVLDQIDTITAGGGTNMYPAIEKAFLAPNETFAELKHTIVLTDGLSSPGDFEQLARDAAAAGITVSTVAVGKEAAEDLLGDLAAAGGGNFYYCDDPAAMPAIFATETISAGKVGITEAPLLARVVGPADVLPGVDFAQLPTLLGYVETRVKPAGRLILTAKDDDPLLAAWQFGRGTSVAFTSDAHARWAAAWLRWPQFGRFWGQLVRYAMRKDPGSLPYDRHRGSVVGYPAELRVRPTNVELLRSIAEATGGTYDPTPAEALAATDRTVPRTTRLWPYLMVAALLIFLVDLTLKRVKLK